MTGAVAIAVCVRRVDGGGTGGLCWRQEAARLYHYLRRVSLLLTVPYVQVAKRAQGDFPAMKLLAFYIVFVVIGEAIAYAVGRTVETWSQTASLPAFLACFFFVLWAAWRVATHVA